MKQEYAFPSPVDPKTGVNQLGVTVGDYFAAKAMQGLLAGLLADGMDLKWEDIAVDAYRMSKAMMEARK